MPNVHCWPIIANRGHLHKHHALLPQCPRCWEVFRDEGLRDAHLQIDPPCGKKDNDTLLDGFSKAQEKRLRSRKKADKNMTGADKWREVYLILFPDDDPEAIPSPCKLPTKNLFISSPPSV